MFAVDINERSLTHKLGEHLQRAFSEWDVDCEYNRLGMAIKRLPPPTGVLTGDTEGQTISPDIVVHKRRERKNLLVVEVKKTGNNRPGDEQKLVGFTEPAGDYGYTLGLHLILDCETAKVAAITCYRVGLRDDELTAFADVMYRSLG